MVKTTRKQILLVEDDSAVLMMLKLRLLHEGFDVVLARNGEEALQCVEANGVIDLIIMDVKMPKLDGFQVCKQLKSNPTTAKIPIIIYTASERHFLNLADRCMELGVSAWLKKPFQSEELLEKIHHVLGRGGTTHV